MFFNETFAGGILAGGIPAGAAMAMLIPGLVLGSTAAGLLRETLFEAVGCAVVGVRI